MIDRRWAPMDWTPFIEDGSVAPFENGRELAMGRIYDSWDGVVRARACFLDSCFAEADKELRQAMADASEALCFHYGYRPFEPVTFEFSERLCTSFFEKRLGDGTFDRARLLHDMLPLPRKPLSPERAKVARRSVAAASELAALVESFIYV